MRLFKSIFTIFLVLVLTTTSFSCKKRDRNESSQIDSLFISIKNNQYSDFHLTNQLADSAYALSQKNKYRQGTALTYMGFCAFMRMNLEKSAYYYEQVYTKSHNQITLLRADIGLMRICQRTAMNKEFYDHRYNALKRIERINEEINSLTDAEIEDFWSIQTDFYLTEATYFYYLQQEDKSLNAILNIPFDNKLKEHNSHFLNYLYLRSIIESQSQIANDETMIRVFDALCYCITFSHKHHYIYFEANASQALAQLLNNPTFYRLVASEKSRQLRNLNADNLLPEALPLALANNALKLFQAYGDMYQVASTHRAIASCYNQLGQHEQALQHLTTALDFVNKHYETYYQSTDSTEILQPYIPQSTQSIELKWIMNGIKTVPEWIARIREQLSLTYAALNMKQASDYNRNIYLDILDYTRQDKELESRYTTLQKESATLTYLFFAICLITIILIPTFILLYRQWHNHHKLYIHQLKEALNVCKRITLSIPSQATSKEELMQIMQNNIQQEVVDLLHAESFIINGNQNITSVHCLHTFALLDQEKDEIVGYVHVIKISRLNKEELALLKVILPYLTWAIKNGLTLLNLTDEQDNLEKLCYLHNKHYEDHKRQNLIKKSCLFLVQNLSPYIDRIIHEINHTLITNEQITSLNHFSINYIEELITRINEYNDILALWIKVKQGTLNLNIENFSLNELFAILQKSRKAFEMKQQDLIIHKTQSIIKADKALTLFMINTLAENARKYTKEGGRIEISSTETEKYVEISVTDNGPGLSEEDKDLIIHSKVYDSGKIGLSSSDVSANKIAQQKGYGFGLMNCKGIIEKYKKTNSLFNICTFQVESTLGKGSRFYFRLPKGILHTIIVICLFGCFSCHPKPTTYIDVTTEADSTILSNELLQTANLFADSVYHCNVQGNYELAIQYADSVFHYLNTHHRLFTKELSPSYALLSDSIPPAELRWFADGFTTDYYTLLDVRNEAAVAFLAMYDLFGYQYNNNAYTTLYRQISKDNTLSTYCKKIQHSANNKIVGIILLLVLIGIFIIGFYMYHLRHRLLYRYRLEQVLNINQLAFNASSAPQSQQILYNIVEAIYDEINELFRIESLGIAVKQPETDQTIFALIPNSTTDEVLKDNLSQCFNKQQLKWEKNGPIISIPLWIETEKKHVCIGALTFVRLYNNEHDGDLLLMELIANYISVIVYNSMILREQKQQDIEFIQDELHRIIHEENLLHVQNQVLDNCLSTIKHETLYYPNKIKQVVEKLKNPLAQEDILKNIETISELISYYKDILTILSSCATKQSEQTTFRRSHLSAQELGSYCQTLLQKKIRQQSKFHPTLNVQTENLTVICDSVLCKYLLESLLDESLTYPSNGELSLTIRKDNDFARFEFTDYRRQKTVEELNNLFYPSLTHIMETNTYQGTIYLLCKQIVREHDEYGGRRGCRINAEATPDRQGFTVWFTLPITKYRS